MAEAHFVNVGERIRYIGTSKYRYETWPKDAWLEKGITGTVTEFHEESPEVIAGGERFEAIPAYAVVNWDFGGQTAIDAEYEGVTWERIELPTRGGNPAEVPAVPEVTEEVVIPQLISNPSGTVAEARPTADFFPEIKPTTKLPVGTILRVTIKAVGERQTSFWAQVGERGDRSNIYTRLDKESQVVTKKTPEGEAIQKELVFHGAIVREQLARENVLLGELQIVKLAKPPAVEVAKPPVEHRGTEPEGIAIGDELGLRYDGIQEELGMQFTDVRQTGTTFYATSIEEARQELRNKRRLFGMAEEGNPVPKKLDLVKTLAIIDSRPKGKIIESKLREEFGDAVIDALRQGRYVVSGSAGYNPPLLVSLKGRELIQRGNPGKDLITKEEAIGLLERLSMTPKEAARSLVADEPERREILQTVQERVKREQNKWAPMDPREGPPLPRIFAGLRWPWKK